MLSTFTRPGRAWAYAGALLGGAVSVAANVAHSYVPPATAGSDWTPPAGAVIGAVFWPLALFVAVEILARVAWPADRRWWLLRFAGLVPVAAVAAGVSYGHLSGLLSFYGEASWTAAVGPLAVDGLMVMATGALIATGRVNSAPGMTAKAVAEPVKVTPNPTSVDVSGTGKVTPEKAVQRVRPRPASAMKVARAAAKMPTATPAQIAAKAGVSESTVRRHLSPSVPSPTAAPPAETAANAAAPVELAEAAA